MVKLALSVDQLAGPYRSVTSAAWTPGAPRASAILEASRDFRLESGFMFSPPFFVLLKTAESNYASIGQSARIF
jgi:hypothetical protein